MNINNFEELEDKIEYSFKNKRLLLQACTSEDYVKENPEFESFKILVNYGKLAFEYCSIIKKDNIDNYINEKGYLVVDEKIRRNDFIDFYVSTFEYMYDMDKYVLVSKAEKRTSLIDIFDSELLLSLMGAVFVDSSYDFKVIYKVFDKIITTLSFDEEYSYFLDNISININVNLPKYSVPVKGCFSCERNDEYICYVDFMGKKYRGISNSKFNSKIAAAYNAYRKEYKNIMFKEVGKPNRDSAITQLDKLFQLDYINEPRYLVEDYYFDDDTCGWEFNCSIDENEFQDEVYVNCVDKDREEGDKEIAYKALCRVLDWPYYAKVTS